eukprot:CAMPEP_0114674392 /NCGR_PEP_ID=MMETSP0191-20121206/46253_1 /TAXON_ID=126664 /ORGANISM="Sorites sp." /LENGTH=47 /DNA_ID= /DNA_START= /DNA_END= /DNA_ORIENTATION=
MSGSMKTSSRVQPPLGSNGTATPSRKVGKSCEDLSNFVSASLILERT